MSRNKISAPCPLDLLVKQWWYSIYHAKIPGVTRPEQLFLRPYGDSHGADHYAQYLRGVSEASAQVRGAKSPGSPKSIPTQSVDAPSGNLDRE